MTDDELAALCIWEEARGEIYDGKVWVAQVIRNRMHVKYQSDGTIEGTILYNAAFSGFWFDFIDGKYTRVCHTLEEAKAKAEIMLETALKSKVWADCIKAWSKPALSYVNLKISDPSWATPDKFVTKIGNHSFYSN